MGWHFTGLLDAVVVSLCWLAPLVAVVGYLVTEWGNAAPPDDRADESEER